jgi:hypothetical protein
MPDEVPQPEPELIFPVAQNDLIFLRDGRYFFELSSCAD